MQNVQKLEPLVGQQPSITSPRVLSLRPSVWERVGAWARRTLTGERVTEAALVAATVLLMVWLFVGLSRALEHYSIIPLP